MSISTLRAAMCDTLTESDHSIIQRRLRERVRLTRVRPYKRGQLKPLTEHDSAAPADIWQVASHPKQWLMQAWAPKASSYHAIG